MKESLEEIRQVLIDCGVPLADKRKISDSIRWLNAAYKGALDREKYIENKFGISVIQNKCDDMLILDFDTKKIQEYINNPDDE